MTNPEPAPEQPENPPEPETRVGQVVQSLARATRQIAVPPPPREETVATGALRERIVILIYALGDPNHPLHHRAVADLVNIGAPAVSALSEALRPNRPWLTSYRAIEALGQIGDGRAAGSLLEALRHPNSNVRWGAVQALTTVGDARTLMALRRVARDDRGKTSWGESVGGAARSALDQMQERNVLLRGVDLVKTAAAGVLMLISLILALSVITTVQTELNAFGAIEPGGTTAPLVRTVAPLNRESSEAVLPGDRPTPEPSAPTATTELTPTLETVPVLAAFEGSVLAGGNVRGFPVVTADNIIGSVNAGDQILFVASTADRFWFRVQLGERRSASSRIDSPDGSGWVSRSLLSEPPEDLPFEEP